MLAFSLVSVLFLYGFLRLQHHLLLSLGMPGMKSDQAFNTAASFVSNTNWQSYSGESTLGHLVQMSGLAVQNFVSAAVGIAVVAALIRGFTRRKTDRVGNFWVDLTRIVLRVLLPICVRLRDRAGGLRRDRRTSTALTDITTIAGDHQSITGGPVASQEAIKELGTNGGGFYNANSAHPFENPTALHQPGGDLPDAGDRLRTAAHLRHDGRRQAAGLRDRLRDGPDLGGLGRPDHRQRAAQRLQSAAGHAAGGMMEGKEQRFGIWASALFAASTTLTSTGAVNSFHDSFTPGGGGMTIFNMMLGEIAPGGTGSGLYGILILAIIAVFVAGLMVGRTPGVPGQEARAARR